VITLPLRPVKRERIEFDSRLSHNVRDPEFDPEWRLFFPRNLK
jgi:hypothetical protein